MTLTERDRRILMLMIPVVIIVAYWFLLLSPKRDDLKTARDNQHQQEQRRDTAVAQAAQLESARQTFPADYAQLVLLGKAIPADIDAPSLLVQLDQAANGSHIDFASVTFGARQTGVTVPTAPPPSGPAGNAAAGGAPATTGLGRAAENAGNAVNAGNQASQNVDQASGGGGGTTTTAAPNAGAASQTAPALESVPLTFSFTGSYFDLADFFHRLKRFVYVAGSDRIFVRGRLLTIDSLSFSPGGQTAGAAPGPSGELSAAVSATVYLSPKSQGTTAGATAAGPAGAAPAAPAGNQTSSVPTAVVTR
jgi:Tfp pilus assembly protein PilO